MSTEKNIFTTKLRFSDHTKKKQFSACVVITYVFMQIIYNICTYVGIPKYFFEDACALQIRQTFYFIKITKLALLTAH